ncbi:hypothetical protein ACFLWS_03990 [Chloroflexota bacterium]
MLKNLFKPRTKLKNTHQRYPEAYFKTVYLAKDVAAGIEIIARIKKVSRKELVNRILRDEISRYIGGILILHIETQRINRLRGEGVEPLPEVRGIKEIRKYVREHDNMSQYRMKKYGL